MPANCECTALLGLRGFADVNKVKDFGGEGNYSGRPTVITQVLKRTELYRGQRELDDDGKGKDVQRF